MNKVLKNILIYIIYIWSINSFSQSLNDYKTMPNATGNWTRVSNWQRFDGTSWKAATNYPGQVTGANDVSIVNGAEIVINTTIATTEIINSITIGDNNSTAAVEKIFIDANSGINTTSFNILTDGLLRWNTNSIFSLPESTNLFIETNPTNTLGTFHGLYDRQTNGDPCSNAKTLQIGTDRYATCKGAGTPISFDEVNDDGGTTPTSTLELSSNGNNCLNKTINFTATSTANSPTYVWSSSTATGGIVNTNSNTTTAQPTSTGVIVYQVTDGTITKTISLLIENCPPPSSPKKIITNRRITFRVKK